MNSIPEMDLNLEKLFLPAWAQESASDNRYAHHAGGGEDRSDRKRDFQPGRRPQRRDQGENRGPRSRDDRRPGGRDQRGPGRGDDRQRRERPEPPPPLPEVNVSVVPDENGVESLGRQIKATGRAYPLFGIAQIILQKPERFSVKFSVKKAGDAKVAQPLFVCALDETLWLSEEEVVAHVLKTHFATFYQAERTATEPPKGTYTFVGQCGMSGIILGPPNHHDYQNQLRKLHAERFARMPFEAFKARVKIVRDEVVVKKWVDDQSWKTEYICLNVPEALTLPNLEEVEKHFRAVHKEAIVKSVQEHTLSGVTARGMRCNGLLQLVRQVVEDQRHFPLVTATGLSQRFGSMGLHFFKVNKAFTHVSVARPNFLDLENTPVSDGIKRIVEYINAKPKCTRRQLVESLAPTPKPAPIVIHPVSATADSAADAPKPEQPKAAVEPTAEQTAVIGDLHWLIHQGHVIEFADGRMETAKKPVPKPPKPAAKQAPTPTETTVPETAPAEAVVADSDSSTAPTPDATEATDSATTLPPADAPQTETTEVTAEPLAESTIPSESPEDTVPESKV